MPAQAALPFVPFARPVLGREEEEAVLAVMRSGWLTTGDVAARFEQEFSACVGARHALALNSATAGLHLALEALGVGPGDAVATTPFTFAATAEVARYLGADPLFVDIDLRTLTLDAAALDRALQAARRAGRRVAAILPVHVAGVVSDMDGIGAAARAHGIPVLEDAAHSFPVRWKGRHAGTLGDAGVYSFYATKSITTGEGGMLVTDRDEVAARARVMRLHGIDRDVWKRYTSPGAGWRYDVVAPGYKYNMTDLAAAIGRVQLRRAEEFLRRRAAVARRYVEGLADARFLVLPAQPADHAWHLFIVRVLEEALTIDRDRFIDELRARGIGTSVHFLPLHLMAYYRDRYGHAPGDFPVAEACARTCLSLPLSAGITDEEAGRVIDAVRAVGAQFAR